MIYVRIELWPGGSKAHARCLQEGIIHNTGGDHTTGEYAYLLSKVGGFHATDQQLARAEVKHVLRRGEIKGFPRLRLYAHDLLLRALTLAFGARADWGAPTPKPLAEPQDTWTMRLNPDYAQHPHPSEQALGRALNPDNGHGAADGMGGHGEYCECSGCLADDRARHGG